MNHLKGAIHRFRYRKVRRLRGTKLPVYRMTSKLRFGSRLELLPTKSRRTITLLYPGQPELACEVNQQSGSRNSKGKEVQEGEMLGRLMYSFSSGMCYWSQVRFDITGRYRTI